MTPIKVWRVWKYALGSFADEKTKRYDNPVVIVRSFVFLTYLITNCFIISGVIRHWNSMDKMDTQGMSGPSDPNWKGKPQVHKPATITPRRLFTETYAKEMKILINEVLDEREYKKRMNGPYDVPTDELPPSYFDTVHYKYLVGEEEPPYQDWSQPSD